MSARVVLVLIDGLGDVSVPSLGFRTPLQATPTPTLDALAAAGVCGLLDPVSPGRACGSDTAHLSLLGYDPRECYRGRGAFESMGTGLDMAAGDVAFKCNFATLAPLQPAGAGADVDESDAAAAAAAAALPRTVASRRADRHFEADGRACFAPALRVVCAACARTR
jgi:2,3-diphosphopglycerate-independent phosphoglycerate mutase